MKSKKVILDTNLWISFLISDKINFIEEFIETNKIKLIFSDELIEEFLKVINRPKFKKYFPISKVERLLDCFDNYGKLIEINSNLKFCRDEKDDFLLNLSVDSNADYLITGDKDLLVLEKIENTKIINFTDFINELKV